MSHLRLLGGAALLATSACLSTPTFDPATATEPSTTASASAEMVLVGPSTLGGDTLQPTGKDKAPPPADCKDAKHCKDAKTEDKGKPTPAAPPAPAGEAPAPAGGAILVPSFWIDVREVSASDFAACVSAGACAPAGSAPDCTSTVGLGDHPINCVSKAEASAYCTWRSKRLLRKEEWTAAVSGSSSRPFAWGAELPSADRLNACGSECASSGMYSASDRFVATAPTGSFPAGSSPEGVLDLAGNVAEWVEGEPSVVRGGSFADTDAASLSSTAARAVAADTSDPTIGFRCARNPK